MVARINLIPNPPKALTPTVVNCTGLAPSTAYVLWIHQGAYAPEIRVPVVSDASGAASATMVAQAPGGGGFTIEVLQTVTTSQVSLSFNTVGTG